MTYLRRRNKSTVATFVVVLCTLIFTGAPFAFAIARNSYAPGQPITLGDFVYDDDFVATTTACTISIWSPSGAAVVTDQAVTANVNGWHYYTYSTTTQGIYPAAMTCGSAINGTLVRDDFTFIVATTSSASSTDEIAASVAAAVKVNTDSAILSASSSLFSTLPSAIWGFSARTLSSFGTLAADVWTTGSRTLTSGTAIAADIWAAGTRTLTAATLSSGSLALQSDVTTASTSIAAVVNANTTSATSGITTAVNANTTLASSSIAAIVNANTNATVQTASTSLGATLSALPSNVWNVATSTLTTVGSIGKQLATNVDTTISSVVGGAALTASDVWTYATRTLTSGSLTSGSLALQSDVVTASTSVAVVVNANTNTATAGVTSAVNANTNSASSSLAAAITAVPLNVWSYSARTLSSFGTLAADVWANGTRTLTSLTLSSQSPWTVSMSDFGTITAGSTYRATATTIYNGTLTDSLAVPLITVYDPNRNVVVNAAPMTRTGVGTYEYAYLTNVSATGGVWESTISANVETGKTLPGNDYWNVTTAPPQVIIQSMNSTVVPSVSANVRITNEGTVPYEYQYEWCVVSSSTNSCGGGDDLFYASAAKLVTPGENFDTVLGATVPVPGTYFFKVAVYYGTEVSRSSLQFTATNSGGTGGGGGGGGGGTGGGSLPPTTPPIGGTCSSLSADVNGDCKVNAIDFSILLAFWKTLPPFRNVRVDINADTHVNATDFSIMLYQWGSTATS